MQVTKKELPKSQVELMVEVSSEEMRPYLDKAAEEISKTTSISGFRQGKAPYSVVVREVGEMRVMQEAIELAVRGTYPQAVKDNNLVTIGSPKIDVEKVAPGNPFVYKATVALYPSVELGDFKSVQESKREVKVEDKDVDGAVENLRKMLSKEKKVDRPVQEGDKIEADIDTYVDKVPVDEGQTKNHAIILGEGQFVPGFEDNVIGMKAGDIKEFTVKFPKEYHRKDLANRDVEFKVKVNTVYEMEKPKIEDAFAQQIGPFKTVDDLRKQLTDNITQEKKAKEQQRWELAVVDQIVKKTHFGELPEVLIEAELDKMMHELEHNVQEQGMKWDDYLNSIKKTKEDLRKEFIPKAEQRIKAAIIMREIAEKEKIHPEDSEIQAEVEKGRQQYKDNPEVLKKIDTDEYRDYVKTTLQTRKVIAYLEKTIQE